jgi:hypothetical protein
MARFRSCWMQLRRITTSLSGACGITIERKDDHATAHFLAQTALPGSPCRADFGPGYLFMKCVPHTHLPAPDSTAQSPQSPDAGRRPEQPAAEDFRAARGFLRQNAPIFPKLPAVLQIRRRLGPSATATPALGRTEPTPHTRHLVAGLTNLDFSHGPITKEQAEQWEAGFAGADRAGAHAAVPGHS